jgi:hypothetical protein
MTTKIHDDRCPDLIVLAAVVAALVALAIVATGPAPTGDADHYVQAVEAEVYP